MIREERDPAFWSWVCSHPQVAETGADAAHVCEIASRPNCLPLASEHGGFLFLGLDAVGRIYELHSLFRPEGWGREVHAAGKAALERLFATGCEILTTYEVEGNRRSQPPRSFGFAPTGDFGPTPHGNFRTWLLTRNAWRSSPAGRPKCP